MSRPNKSSNDEQQRTRPRNGIGVPARQRNLPGAKLKEVMRATDSGIDDDRWRPQDESVSHTAASGTSGNADRSTQHREPNQARHRRPRDPDAITVSDRDRNARPKHDADRDHDHYQSQGRDQDREDDEDDDDDDDRQTNVHSVRSSKRGH